MKVFGNGRNGWALLIVGVAVWDILFEDSLSEAFSRALRSRRSAPPVVAAWALLTAHLFDILPPQYDPFTMFLRGGKRITLVTQLTVQVRRQQT